MTLSLRLASIMLLTFFVFSCNHKAVNSLLDSVESVMDSDAAYADSLIRRIDPNSVSGKRLRARYALLQTAVDYKNYRTFTTDSLIMEAVNYYSISDNADYSFLSYYYLGCVYLELGRITEASVAFAQAELMVDEIENDHWKGLLYSQLGDIFNISCDYNRALNYYEKSVSYFARAGSKRHKLHDLLMQGEVACSMMEFNRADSIFRILEKELVSNVDSVLQNNCWLHRLSCFLYMEESDSATAILNKYGIVVDESSDNIDYLLTMARYYTATKDFEKSKLLLERACHYAKTDENLIYCYFFLYKLADRQGDSEKALKFYTYYSSLQNEGLRDLLSNPVLGALYSNYRSVSELESTKARNKITVLVALVIITILVVFIISYISWNRRQRAEHLKREYLSTINELTSQISINRDKISTLNTRVRELLRNQFDPSDYLYTRYYEQIDDNKKAERIYRVVRSQLESFTNQKNIGRIDEMLDQAFDGMMSKVLSSGLEIKEKDLLILRYVLTGFSAKSIAALLGETHLNVNQRKKRLLDRIQIQNPDLFNELHNILNISKVSL